MGDGWFEGWIDQGDSEDVADVTAPRVFSAVVRGSGQPSDVVMDGVIRASSTAGTTSPNGLAVNAGYTGNGNPYGHFNESSPSEVAEIVVFDRALSVAEREQVEAALIAKWDLPVVVPRNITGAFTVTATARFDNPAGGSYQRVFDFGVGAGVDNVLLSQIARTNDMLLQVHRGSTELRYISAPGAIVAGETATWRVGVDPDGLMWIEKNGTRIASGAGFLPRVVERPYLLVGESNWGSGDTPLIGAVTSLSVRNL